MVINGNYNNSGEPPRPLPARPLQRRDRHQDHREQAGRGRLPHLDAHLPQVCK